MAGSSNELHTGHLEQWGTVCAWLEELGGSRRLDEVMAEQEVMDEL